MYVIVWQYGIQEDENEVAMEFGCYYNFHNVISTAFKLNQSCGTPMTKEQIKDEFYNGNKTLDIHHYGIAQLDIMDRGE